MTRQSVPSTNVAKRWDTTSSAERAVLLELSRRRPGKRQIVCWKRRSPRSRQSRPSSARRRSQRAETAPGTPTIGFEGGCHRWHPLGAGAIIAKSAGKQALEKAQKGRQGNSAFRTPSPRGDVRKTAHKPFWRFLDGYTV